MASGVAAAGLVAALAVGTLGVVGTGASAAAAGDPVRVHDGQLMWPITSTAPTGRKWLLHRRPCLSLAGAVGATLCVTAADTARITTPARPAYSVPISTRRADPLRWRVAVRLADLPQSLGAVTATTDCAGCLPASAPLLLPRLRVTGCVARSPWLVHQGDPEVGRAVALTFDDGPGPNTRRVLRILRQHHAAATFFSLGRMVERDPAAVRRLVRAGHAVGNHSFTHPVLHGDDSAELRRTNQALQAAGAPRPCLFRAPYGENPPEVVDLARRSGLTTVHWNTDPGDWRGLTADQMTATTLAQTRPGSIMVFHDGEPGRAMPRALPRILDALELRGYRFLTIPELLRLPVTYAAAAG